MVILFDVLSLMFTCILQSLLNATDICWLWLILATVTGATGHLLAVKDVQSALWTLAKCERHSSAVVDVS